MSDYVWDILAEANWKCHTSGTHNIFYCFSNQFTLIRIADIFYHLKIYNLYPVQVNGILRISKKIKTMNEIKQEISGILAF